MGLIESFGLDEEVAEGDFGGVLVSEVEVEEEDLAEVEVEEVLRCGFERTQPVALTGASRPVPLEAFELELELDVFPRFRFLAAPPFCLELGRVSDERERRRDSCEKVWIASMREEADRLCSAA